MTTAPALLPCPFCDSQFVMSGRDFESYPAPNYYIAFCSSCDAVGPNKDAPEQAIAAWNARPGGDEAARSALSIACDRLQEFLDTFGDIRDYVTQSDIDDWRENALRARAQMERRE